MRKRYIPVLTSAAVLLALSIGLSACGGGSEATPTPSRVATATAKPSATGQAVTTATAGASPTSGRFTIQAANNATLGKMILVNAQGMTLYRYDKDTAGTSNCTGSCATVWPPLTASGDTPTAAQGVTGTLATISRADGTKQVTYNGTPLYTFQQDKKPGDASGDNVNSFHVATR